jgi:hypothetical protein
MTPDDDVISRAQLTALKEAIRYLCFRLHREHRIILGLISLRETLESLPAAAPVVPSHELKERIVRLKMEAGWAVKALEDGATPHDPLATARRYLGDMTALREMVEASPVTQLTREKIDAVIREVARKAGFNKLTMAERDLMNGVRDALLLEQEQR